VYKRLQTLIPDYKCLSTESAKQPSVPLLHQIHSQILLKLNVMNSLRNRVQLIGRLGDDPEIRNLEKGNKMAKFALATNDTYYKDGQKTEETQWHNLVVWGKLSEVCEKHLKKGKEIAIEGKLQYRSWKDKEGRTRSNPQITVISFTMTNGTA
jgi:single-strand DNA-binding protein